jgi:hypothetical protein
VRPTIFSQHLQDSPSSVTPIPCISLPSLFNSMPSPPRSFTTSFPSDADLFYFCTTSSTSAEDLNIRYALPSKSSLKIGVVILSQHQTQLLDLAALDLLATIGRNRLSKLNASTDALDEAVDEIDVRYVTSSGEGSFPVTSGGRIPTTVS